MSDEQTDGKNSQAKLHAIISMMMQRIRAGNVDGHAMIRELEEFGGAQETIGRTRMFFFAADETELR